MVDHQAFFSEVEQPPSPLRVRDIHGPVELLLPPLEAFLLHYRVQLLLQVLVPPHALLPRGGELGGEEGREVLLNEGKHQNVAHRGNWEDQNNDEGMYGRNVMRLLRNIGMCEEKDYPYGKIEHKDNIPAELFEKAKVNVIKSYARIHEIDDLKLSLKRNGPALICFQFRHLVPLQVLDVRSQRASQRKRVGVGQFCLEKYHAQAPSCCL